MIINQSTCSLLSWLMIFRVSSSLLSRSPFKSGCDTSSSAKLKCLTDCLAPRPFVDPLVVCFFRWKSLISFSETSEVGTMSLCEKMARTSYLYTSVSWEWNSVFERRASSCVRVWLSSSFAILNSSVLRPTSELFSVLVRCSLAFKHQSSIICL